METKTEYQTKLVNDQYLTVNFRVTIDNLKDACENLDLDLEGEDLLELWNNLDWNSIVTDLYENCDVCNVKMDCLQNEIERVTTGKFTGNTRANSPV